MKRAVVVIVVVALAVAMFVVGGRAWLRSRVNEPYPGYPPPDQVVEIPPGEATRAIGRRLVAAGVVRNELTFRAALWVSGDARRLKAGEYRFNRPMSALEVIGKIARGEVDLVSVTFPEGLTIAEMARVFESSGFGPSAAFVEASRDASLVRSIDASAPDLEGTCFRIRTRCPGEPTPGPSSA